MIDLKNMTDLEKLSAYIDNELSPIDRTELEQRLAVDAELQQSLAKLEQSNDIAHTYFSELDSKPLPMNLEAMILNAKPPATDRETSHSEPQSEMKQESAFQSATIIDLFRGKKRGITGQSWGLASAASILLAVGIWMLMPPTPSNIDDSLLALLNTEPSGAVVAVNPELKIEVLASYQDSQGTVCRSLVEHSPTRSNPILACLKQGQWQINTTDMGEHYQTASSSEVHNKQGLMTPEKEQLWLNTRAN